MRMLVRSAANMTCVLQYSIIRFRVGTDAVVMNLLMSRAVAEQLAEFSTVSYQPLAEAFRQIAPIEAHHGELALEGTVKLVENGESQDMQRAVDYWWPRVAVSFGRDDPKRFEHLKSLGLRHRANTALRETLDTGSGCSIEKVGFETTFLARVFLKE